MNSFVTKASAGLFALALCLSISSIAQAEGQTILQSSYQQTTNIHQGETNTFHAVVQNTTGTEQKILIDLELYNSDNQKVAQQFYDTTSITPYNIADEILTSPNNLGPGTYTWKVGIFNSGWSGLIAWYDNPLTFTVAGDAGSHSGDITLSSSALGEFHVNNCPTVTAVLNNSSIDRRNVLIDFELRDANGTLVNQYFQDNFTVQSALTRSPTFIMNQCDTKLANGTYFYSIGIFNPQWNGLIHWYSNVQTFTVNVGQ
jgi:hypothetical protein